MMNNPNTVKFCAAHRSVCIDSLFVKSQNTNCIEDVDSFLLKLGSVPSGSKQSTPVLVSDQTTLSPPLSHDLAGVSNMPPNMTPQEENIIVYLANLSVMIESINLEKARCCFKLYFARLYRQQAVQ